MEPLVAKPVNEWSFRSSCKKLLEDVGGELVDEALGAVEVVVVLADDAGKAGGSGTHRKVEQVVHLQMTKTFT